MNDDGRHPPAKLREPIRLRYDQKNWRAEGSIYAFPCLPGRKAATTFQQACLALS